MIRNRLFAAVLVAIALLWGTLAGACTRPPSQGATAAIPTRAAAQALFSAQVTAWVNYERCRNGRGPVADNAGLARVSAGHATAMAQAGRLSHTIGAGPLATVRGRLNASGVRFRNGSENIAQFPRYQFPIGMFRVISAASCRFATQAGKTIAPHSYATLAQAAVTGWMKSSAHRRNLLDRKVSQHGAGLAYSGKAPNCGVYYLAQAFAG